MGSLSETKTAEGEQAQNKKMDKDFFQSKDWKKGCQE